MRAFSGTRIVYCQRYITFAAHVIFERIKNEMIVVVAPSGSLGVVIGNPTGFPAVHAIKDTSPIIDMIQIGDNLVSVDGEDTTRMSAIRVSSLIGSKASNPQRILVFARPIRQ